MPDINTLPVTSSARVPASAVKLNGVIVPGWISWETDNNALRAADTFRIEFAVSALPAGYGPDWFSRQTEIDAEIFATADYPDGSYSPVISDRLILGQVDDVDYRPGQTILTISGRDFTARLIDSKTSESHLNQTASQLATLLAQRHGLTPVVKATTEKIGTFYSQNFVNLKQERSEWDILCELADYEDFDVFVTGNELHFQPKPADNGNRYAIVWTPGDVPDANVTDLEFGRSLTIAKGVVVIVNSWHGKHKKVFSATYPKGANTTSPGKSGSNSPIIYRKSVANKTQDEATQIARRIYNDVTRHMMTMNADMPADNLLTCTTIVQVRGTGTAWDQDYFPDSVKRYFSVDEGYRMSFTAKNVSQEYQANE